MTGPATLRTAMLIDDEKIDQMMYRRVIDRSGLIEKVIAFQYAEEALAYLKRPEREQIDVIFLDINMPRMNGFEFLEQAIVEFGDDFVEAVVIMLTTSLDPDDKRRASACKVVKAFINKPLTFDNLSHVVDLVGTMRTEQSHGVLAPMATAGEAVNRGNEVVMIEGA